MEAIYVYSDPKSTRHYTIHVLRWDSTREGLEANALELDAAWEGPLPSTVLDRAIVAQTELKSFYEHASSDRGWDTAPCVLMLDPLVSDAEFEALCRENDNVQLELTKERAVRIDPPAGGWTSIASGEISFQLAGWLDLHESGRVFESSMGYGLPDGSVLSPDASYLSVERLKQLPKGALRGFPKVCPDFVIELLSESNTLENLQAKMQDWMANGAQLGWMIDPYERQVFVYRPGKTSECVKGEQPGGEGPVEGFVLNITRVWKCYQD